MFKPYYAFIGHRYTRVKRKNHFISFISITSMLGIALGVTVLITVLSVMNGFSKEIRSKMLSMAPHVTISPYSGHLHNWNELVEKLMNYPEILGATPFTTGHGLLVVSGNVKPTFIRGIEPKALNKVYPLEETIIAGELNSLTADSFHVALGKELAISLEVWLGDKITVIIPDLLVSPAGVTPRFKRLTISAIFDSGTNYDDRHAFVHINDAAKLYRLQGGVTGVQIRLQSELQSPLLSRKLNQDFQRQYNISDWTSSYQDFFEAIKMEKTVMWCILLLIVAIAAFNLVSSLVMMVTDKRSDIGILRTMGATKAHIMGIFIFQGGIIGIIGTIIGLIFGLLLAANVTKIVEFVQRLFNVQFISEDVYFIGFVPSVIELQDVIITCTLSVIISLFATIYPALKAGAIQPAEALRYE